MAVTVLEKHIQTACALPKERCPLNVRTVGKVDLDDCTIEKLVYDAEPFSSVTAHLYVPKGPADPVPAVVLAAERGWSKSVFCHQYAGQMYARAGLVVLATDPLGEEERDPYGRVGLCAHDRVALEAQHLGRPLMGKLAWDLMRGIDVLEQRREIVDSACIGVAGHALGATVSAYLAAMDRRVRFALLSSMYFPGGAFAETGVYHLIWNRISYPQLLAMPASRCATLMLEGEYAAVRLFEDVRRNDFQPVCEQTTQLCARAGLSDRFALRVYQGAGHRPYFLTRDALLWIEKHTGLPVWNEGDIRSLPSVRMADWAWENGVTFFEQYFKGERHYGGFVVPDVGVRYFRPCELACLSAEERQSPNFSMDHWMSTIAQMRRENEGSGNDG